MKVTPTAILLWSCAAATTISVGSSTNLVAEDHDGAGQLLEVFVGLQTRMDHDEMHRIHASYLSSPNDQERERLDTDKQVMLYKAKAHIQPCLESFRYSIEDHNNNNGDGTEGGRLQLIPYSKDGSRFHLTGSAKDFAMFLEKRDSTDNKGTVDGKGPFDVSADSYRFPESLAECIGFVGTFHRRRNIDKYRNHDGNQDDTATKNGNIMLASTPLPSTVTGTCVTPNSFFDQFIEKFGPSRAANATTIRNIYGVPPVGGKCYHPRVSAVFEANSHISVDDLTCYSQYNDLPADPMVQFMHLNEQNTESIYPYDGHCGYDNQCICPPSGNYKVPNTGGTGQFDCVEGNLDVQMLLAMSGASEIMSFSYFADGLYGYELMMKQLVQLGEHNRIPAVLSISYDTCEPDPGSELAKNMIEFCNTVGQFSLEHHTTFFVSSGDCGAGNLGSTGTCGTYCPLVLASCPFVTTVGGTFGTVPGEEVLSVGSKAQGLNIVSGGGFSKIFTSQNNFNLTYQEVQVQTWRNRHAASNSMGGYEYEDKKVGAAYPDVSALSANILQIVGNFPNEVAGTSASAPIFAGIVNLCASQLPEGQAGFGWINPTLYKNQDIFFDIKRGNNQYSGDVESQYYCYEGCEGNKTGCTDPNTSKPFYGFEATKGWDPASGLGTLGTTDPTDPKKGFRGLCDALLKPITGKSFKFAKLDCKSKKKSKAKKTKKPDKVAEVKR